MERKNKEQPFIITVASGKGGVGKTAMAATLAVELTRREVKRRSSSDGTAVQSGTSRVLLLDFDATNNTLRLWAEERRGRGIVPYVFCQTASNPEIVKPLAQSGDYDYIVIDSLPYAMSTIHRLAVMSDLVIIPTNARLTEMQAAGEFAKRLTLSERRSGRDGSAIEFRIGINRVQTEPQRLTAQKYVNGFIAPGRALRGVVREMPSLGRKIDAGGALTEVGWESVRQETAAMFDEIVGLIDQISAARPRVERQNAKRARMVTSSPAEIAQTILRRRRQSPRAALAAGDAV